MRARLPLLAALPALAFLARPVLAPHAVADEPPRIELKIGEERTGLGIMPRCDDFTVVAITADGHGLRGVKPGTTICSFDVTGGGGARRVWRVVVLEPSSSAPGGRGGAEDGTSGAPPAGRRADPGLPGR